ALGNGRGARRVRQRGRPAQAGNVCAPESGWNGLGRCAARRRSRNRNRPEQALRARRRQRRSPRVARGEARTDRRRTARGTRGAASRRAHRRERTAARAAGRAGGAEDGRDGRGRRDAARRSTVGHAGRDGPCGGGGTMKLPHWFIDRPILAAVLSIVVFLAGAIGVWNLPVSEYPEVAPPSIVVNASYPGANPKVIAETVASPLEEAITGVDGMLYMGSQATVDGKLAVTVTFAL